MWLRNICLICALLVVNTQDLDDSDEVSSEIENEKKLSVTVVALIEHFKQPDPVGLPGDIVPDPCPMEDSQQTMPLGMMMYFKNTSVYGVSKFHVKYIHADIERMEVQAAATIVSLQSKGNYTVSSWFDSAHGSYTINATKLNVTGITTLGVQTDGQLKVQNVNIDLALKTITTDFSNLGLLGGMFQNILNSGGPLIFDSMKPFMLQQLYKNFRRDVDAQLDKFLDDMQFPNTIPAIDMLIINAREKVRDMKLDPYRITDYNKTTTAVTMSLFNTWIIGLSSFQRVGNITLKIENNTAVFEFEIGTRTLEGKTQWDVSVIGGFISNGGNASFSVEYIGMKVMLAQPLDTRQRPIFKALDLDIGNIQVRCNGLGTVDYIIELIVNILPNLIRYQIIAAIEGPLKEKIQQEVNKINVEEAIMNNLAELDEMQDLKLSDLMRTNMVERIYDEDEFFNF